MIYKVGKGHNVALGSLETLAPQPTSPGLQYLSVEMMASNNIVTQGPYIPLVWNLVEDAEAILDLFTQFGLEAAMTANVTLLARDDLYQEQRYNGFAVRPAASWSRHFPRNVVITVHTLTLLS